MPKSAPSPVPKTEKISLLQLTNINKILAIIAEYIPFKKKHNLNKYNTEREHRKNGRILVVIIGQQKKLVIK